VCRIPAGGYSRVSIVTTVKVSVRVRVRFRVKIIDVPMTPTD